MRPNSTAPHATPTRQLAQLWLWLLMLMLVGGPSLLCAGCEESRSTRAQARVNDAVLRIRALEPPTLTLEMMPPEPFVRGLLLEATKLSEFDPKAWEGPGRIVKSKPRLGGNGVVINVTYSMEPSFEIRGTDGGALWSIELVFALPESGDEHVLYAIKLQYDNYKLCDAIERVFAETPSHGLCSRRLIPESRGLVQGSATELEWDFCAATPSRRDLVRIRCAQSVGDGVSSVSYNIIEWPGGE
ncbi:MAG: hypothetical protein AUK47_00240 [Deltaproteobacteria bacterium CG2_30_63_29]|nr:MAG: hypothetical protein AUK47_00240 [Deltaproteobacteria bacterium CG2_30_63_29]PJB33906.1 MAG: hypothetical protein CO108_29740 [Deltaproteobacteria bacterium CG_4_9_14_3_um_filter_63_12]